MARRTISRIGIVCSGNTCRSPVTKAWLDALLKELGFSDKFDIWTAGVCPDPCYNSVNEFAKEAAYRMKLPKLNRDELDGHSVKYVLNTAEKSEFIFWITELGDVQGETSSDYESFAHLVEAKRQQLKAMLIVIPEKDEAWVEYSKLKTFDSGSSEYDEKRKAVLNAYIEQGKRLRLIANVISRIIIKH